MTKYDIMHYGPEICDSEGHMTKDQAWGFARTNLEAGESLIGWTGCMSIFQFWAPVKGMPVELPHAEEPPTGRKAAIIATEAREKLKKAV